MLDLFESIEEEKRINMAKADDIEHFCRMIGAHVDTLHGVLTDEGMGYLTRLESIVYNGGFAALETEEEIKLKNTAEELRALADRMDLARDSLILNERRYNAGTG